MDTNFTSKQKDVWSKIELEKRRDRFIRLISITAWVVTSILLVTFVIMQLPDITGMIDLYRQGIVGLEIIAREITPLVVGVGIVTLLIAVLSTVGVFFRLRTASLSEIQLRLAALEEALIDRAGSEE